MFAVRRLGATVARGRRIGTAAPSPAPGYDKTRAVVQTKVLWTTKGVDFVGTDGNGQTCAISGANGVGVSPMHMLLMGLGACAAVDVVGIMRKQQTPLASLEILVSGQRGATDPRPWETAHVLFRASGAGVDRERLVKAVALSTEKYCGVHGTLAPAVKITWDVDVVQSSTTTT